MATPDADTEEDVLLRLMTDAVKPNDHSGYQMAFGNVLTAMATGRYVRSLNGANAKACECGPCAVIAQIGKWYLDMVTGAALDAEEPALMAYSKGYARGARVERERADRSNKTTDGFARGYARGFNAGQKHGTQDDDEEGS